MTFESTDTCMKILELLCAKMEDPSPVVKYKALSVVKQVLQKGNNAFSRELGRKQAIIRDCLNFRGPPDPLRGDAPYAQVRELAQQVINMVYDTEVTTQTPPAFALNTTSPVPSGNGRNFAESGGSFVPQSLGSSNFNGSSTAPTSNYKVSTTVTGTDSNGGRRVFVQTPKAIGSYIEHQPSRWDSILEAVSDGVESFKTSVAGNQPKQSQNGNAHPRSIYGGSSSATSHNLGFEPKYTTGDVSSLDYDGDEGGKSRSPINSTIPDSASLSIELNGLSRNSKLILDSAEYRAVNEITLNGGKRNLLSRTETSAFVSRVRSAPDARPLVECLLVRIFLLDSNWIPSVNALSLLDAIIKNQISNASSVVQPHVAALSLLSSRSVQSAIQEKVQSILQYFPDEVRALSKHSNGSSAPSSELINGAADNHSEDSIFSGLATESHATPQLIEHDDFSFLGASTAPTAPASGVNLIDDEPNFGNHTSNQGDSLFDGLTIDSSSSAPSTSHPQPVARSEPSLLDFMDTPPVSSNREMPKSSTSSEINFDLGSMLTPQPLQPTPTYTSNPTATLGQLQTNTLLYTNVPTTAEGQIAILKGQRAAILDQLELLRLQTMTLQRNEGEERLLTQLKSIETSLADLERTSQASTYTGTSASLESIYRQQPIAQTSNIDYTALQTSHPVDPFDSIRHDIRR